MRLPVSALLRPDLPPPSTFSVSAAPCHAKLDQNESPWPLPQTLVARIEAELRRSPWHRYPQPAQYLDVKSSCAAALGCAPEQLALTVGGDQAIASAFAVAGGPGRSARIFEPTYPMFAHYARVTHTECEAVVLGPTFDVAGHGAGGPVDLLCLVSPNNPTGGVVPRRLLRAALRMDALILVDEAYRDFCEAGADGASASTQDLLAAHDNLLIARSLSKAGLAGVRLGYLLGAPEVIAAVERLLFAPYHLNALQLAAAACLDELMQHVAACARVVKSERARVMEDMQALGVRAYPSEGNFILFDSAAAKEQHARLVARGVRVRNVSGLPGLGAHLRVTIGTPEENSLFLAALEATMASA